MVACKGWWPTEISVYCLKIEISNFLVQVQDNASNTWHWFIRVAVTTIFFLKSIYVEAFEMKILTLSDMVPICENLV